MTIDLRISSFECECGALIYPPASISAKAHKKYIEKIELPITHTKISQEQLLPKWLYDKIQLGLYDDIPDLVRFKSKKYAEGIAEIECISIKRAEYKIWRDNYVILKIAEADTRKTELTTKSKSVIKTETEQAITLEFERFEALYEGNDKIGQVKCPLCNMVLCSWKT